MGVIIKSVAIVGCGWLGLPLAQYLIHRGFEVKGSTRSASKMELLANHGIESYQLDLSEGAAIPEQLLHARSLVINFPPGRRDPKKLANYADAVGTLVRMATINSQVAKFIFVSSSSVYGEELNEFSEETPALPDTQSGKVILEAEKRVVSSGIPYNILRFGGLAGPDRHPGRFLAGRKDLPNGGQSINFLHLEDAVRVIAYMLEHDIQNEIFNVASPMHPNKKLFYPQMAVSAGLEPPTFLEDGGKYIREMSVDKLLRTTDYSFQHPNPMQYTY